jgi:integrase
MRAHGDCVPESWEEKDGEIWCSVCKDLPYTLPEEIAPEPAPETADTTTPDAATTPAHTAAATPAAAVAPITTAAAPVTTTTAKTPAATKTAKTTAAPDSRAARGEAAATDHYGEIPDTVRNTIMTQAPPEVQRVFQNPDGTYLWEKRARINPLDAGNASRLASPDETVMKGRDFAALKIIAKVSESRFARLAVEGLAKSTRNFHRQDVEGVWRFVKAHPVLLDIPMPQIVLRYIRWVAINSRRWWKPQTFQRRLHNTLAGLALLPFYSDAERGVTFKSDPEVAATLKAVALKAAEAQPVGQSAITAEEIDEAISKEPNLSVKIALLLQWLTAARIGDILQLTKADITTSGNGNTGFIDVTFAKGKGVLLRKGKYTVHTVVPAKHRDLWAQWLTSLKQDELVVRETANLSLSARATAINKALKRVNSKYSSRSIRRGALQAMALGTAELPPVDIATLMSYAGHLREETTRRYLDWSRLFGAGAQRERSAAAALAAPSL